MRPIRISINENGLPEAEAIGRELERQGFEVRRINCLPGETAAASEGCRGVIFSAGTLSADETNSIITQLSYAESIVVIARGDPFAADGDPVRAEGKTVFLRRPFALSAVLFAVTGLFVSEDDPEEKLRRKVAGVMTEMGFPQKKAGFGALRDAVVLTLEDDVPGAEGCHIAEAGQLNGQTAGAADKAVARIASAAWSSFPDSLKSLVFGPEAATDERPPSPKETVLAVTRYVKCLTDGNDTSCD